MDILFSIKTKFAFEIFRGKKRFEYRRAIFKEQVERIIVYASSPTRMVIGEFIIEAIFFEELDRLWCRTKRHSGISEEHFYSYFSEKDKGDAIKIGSVFQYQEPISLHDLYGIKPPQSVAYLNK